MSEIQPPASPADSPPEPRRQSSATSKAIKLSLGIAVTLGCLFWAFQQMLQGEGDSRQTASEVMEKIGQAFAQADYRSLPLMWLSLAAFYWLKVVRWKLLLEPLGRFRPVRDLLPSTMVGFAFNNVLPAHLGEFVRVYVFSKLTGLPRTGVLTSIVLERIFDVVAILAFLMLGMIYIDTVDAQSIDPGIQRSAMIIAGVVCAGLLGAAGYLFWTAPMVRFVEGCLVRLTFLPESVREKITDILETGAAGLSSLKSIRLLIGILLTSLAKWFLNGLTIYLSLWAFGIQVSPMVAAIVLGVTAFGVTVPSSPGYFGVIQFCFLLVLKLFTTDTEGVFAASIYYHMVQWIPVTLIGMFFFLRSGFRIADIEAQA
ncbi:MAG: lysylphosphatidylglycerol synthase transmembrane domain-containing protein [Planctomycetaceae bacterium]